MYSESRGFYYEADLKGISDATENVRKAKQSKVIADYEKQIKSLQDTMESETKSIDDQIKKLNEYSEAWGKVSSQLEDAQNALRATEVLGPDWENNILSGLTLLENFTAQYVDAQQRQKDAYLAARAAEANTPVGGSGGGGGGGDYGSYTGYQPKPDPNNTSYKETYWSFNGNKYENEQSALQAYEGEKAKAGASAYEGTYNSQLSARGYDSAPSYVKSKIEAEARAQAEQARKEAENQVAKPKKVTNTVLKALYDGIDSAKAGTALVGELGSEIVLDKKSGTATFVDSPTLMDMKGGEKVFNAEETEKILKSKYVPLKQFNPKKFAMLHAFAGGTSSPMQTAIAAQAVGIASGLKSGLLATSHTGGQTINQTFNVSLPNITDASKANDLFREFEQLSRKATQYFN